MIYTHRKTHSTKNRAIYIGIVFALGVFLFVFRNIVSVFMYRITTNINNILNTKHSLQNQVNTLKQQNEELQGVYTETQLLRDENNNLRNLLKYTKNPQNIIASAEIISKPYRSVSDRIVINRGSDHGVISGDLIIAGDYVLLGTVEQVSAITSVVHLFSSNTYQYNHDFIIKNLGLPVVGKGTGSGNFSFEIPIGTTVADGDVVVMSSYPDRAVAIIKSIDTDPRSPFQKALARTPVNVNELKFVQVIRP